MCLFAAFKKLFGKRDRKSYEMDDTILKYVIECSESDEIKEIEENTSFVIL